MYDQYGFIVNKHKMTGEALDIGDSCYFMFLQALIFCLDGRFDKARELHARCDKIHFYRHPLYYAQNLPGFIKKDTSWDMFGPWDLLHYMFLGEELRRPQFEERESAFWDGRLKERDILVQPAAVKLELKYRREVLAIEDNYYVNNLALIKGRICYERTKNRTVLGSMRKLVKKLEGATTLPDGTTLPNPFFNWLCNNKLGNVELYRDYWGIGTDVWEFGRSPLWRDEYKKRYANTVFHKENGLTFSQQFIELVG